MNGQVNSGEAHVPPRPFQFSLRQLFIACTAVSVPLAAYSWLGMGGLMIGIGLAAFAMFIYFCTRKGAGNGIGATACAIILLFCLFAPNFWAPRGPTRCTACNNKLRSIGLALLQYHGREGCFPPAYLADANGKPTHSWRTLILPCLGQQDVYDAYDFSEAWDGPQNITLARTTLYDFLCPSESVTKLPGQSNYLAVVGPGTAWPGTESATLADLADGPANTILVVEVVGANVAWSEPRDIDIAIFTPAINSKQTRGISSSHPGGANVLFADGHVEFLPANKLPAEVQALITAHAGDHAHSSQ